MHSYVDALDFAGMDFDEAIRCVGGGVGACRGYSCCAELLSVLVQ